MKYLVFDKDEQAVRDRRKTVARVAAARHLVLRPGEMVLAYGRAVEKSAPIARLTVKSVKLVRLDAMTEFPEYGRGECEREGFPDFSPAEFVADFQARNQCGPDAMVSRVEFSYAETIVETKGDQSPLSFGVAASDPRAEQRRKGKTKVLRGPSSRSRLEPAPAPVSVSVFAPPSPDFVPTSALAVSFDEAARGQGPEES